MLASMDMTGKALTNNFTHKTIFNKKSEQKEKDAVYLNDCVRLM